MDVVHENGGKIAAQIVHMGWQSSPKMSGFRPVGPSATVNPWTKIQVPAALPMSHTLTPDRFILDQGRID